MNSLEKIQKEIKNLENQKQKEVLQRFFKTGPGEYAEGDIFLGLKVPQIRSIAKNYYYLSLDELGSLLESKIHEFRFAALVILCEKFKKGKEIEKKEIFNFYIKNAKNINNWDLVDVSAPKIAGEYLLDKDKKTLYKLAKSNNLWEKRIAIVATFSFIRNNGYKDTILISEILLNDKHDLIHKACGWMLREVGKKDEKVLKNYLEKHKSKMPRTMLRYAIEKFPDKIRKEYLSK